MISNANNVINFPKSRTGEDKKPRNNKELQAEFDENKRVYVDHVVEHYSTQLINKALTMSWSGNPFCLW